MDTVCRGLEIVYIKKEEGRGRGAGGHALAPEEWSHAAVTGQPGPSARRVNQRGTRRSLPCEPVPMTDVDSRSLLQTRDRATARFTSLAGWPNPSRVTRPSPSKQTQRTHATLILSSTIKYTSRTQTRPSITQTRPPLARTSVFAQGRPFSLTQTRPALTRTCPPSLTQTPVFNAKKRLSLTQKRRPYETTKKSVSDANTTFSSATTPSL